VSGVRQKRTRQYDYRDTVLATRAPKLLQRDSGESRSLPGNAKRESELSVVSP
jgi:hypothetical protein